VGLKGRWLGRLARVSDPLGVAMVGALFALSFDTVSQAALFAVAGVQAAAGSMRRGWAWSSCWAC
jgi:high-affinity nickel-transport protein